jgi:hypothetical protein
MPSRRQQPRLENANPRTALFTVIPTRLLVKDQLAYCATSYDRFALADSYDMPTTAPTSMNKKSVLRLKAFLSRISAFRLSVLRIEHSAHGRRILAFAHAVHRAAQTNTARTSLRIVPRLLPARIAENACGATWPKLRRDLDRIAIGTFTGPAGTFRSRTEITEAQRDILAKLAIDPPPRIYQLTPASP